MKKNSGFSLIELLTVIAIMAMLAAIVFPIFGSIKRQTKESQCISNLHAIWSAVRQYRLDEGKCPEQMLTVADSKTDKDADGNPLKVIGGLYPEYLTSLRPFTCDAADDATRATRESVTAQLPGGGTGPVLPFSSYDGLCSYDGTNWRYEQHYMLQRTDDQADPDYRRQLSVRYPMDDTVVTWCSLHRGAPNYAPSDRTKDIVLWFSGQIQKVDSSAMDPARPAGNKPWLIEPRKE